jgi:lysophospholipid acyltransferase (LPLAT)-like uncharacterized protein
MIFSKDPSGIGTKWRIIGRAGKTLIDLLFMCSIVHIRGRNAIESILASRQYIFAFWHSRILLVSYLHKGWNAAILVSNSADGEIIAQILQRQGHTTVRGSTGKGGTRAVARIIREMRANNRVGGVVPDGPQGPRYKVQPGVVFLAQKTGCPIIPVTYSAKWCKVFNSWDRFMLPSPASPCLLTYGKPIWVPADGNMDQIGQCTQALENELMRITKEADAYFGHRVT